MSSADPIHPLKDGRVKYFTDEEREQAKRESYRKWYSTHKKDHAAHSLKFRKKQKQDRIIFRSEMDMLKEEVEDLRNENELFKNICSKLVKKIRDGGNEENLV